jgi:hypothetical protein
MNDDSIGKRDCISTTVVSLFLFFFFFGLLLLFFMGSVRVFGSAVVEHS